MKINRRTFLKTIIIGTGAIATGAIAKIVDALGKSEVAKIEAKPLFTLELGQYENVRFVDCYDEFALNPYQKEMLTWTDAKYVVWMSGRRSGKSYYASILKENYRNHSQVQGRRKIFSKQHHKSFRNSHSFRV